MSVLTGQKTTRSLAGILSIALWVGSSTALGSIATTEYSYDINAGTVTRTEPTGNRIKTHYDAINRLSKIELLDSTNIPTYNFYYDLTSQLERITSPEGETIFGYDTFDRLQSITDFGEAAPILRFSYDHKDRLTWIVYPGNGRVCYQYDADGRLTRTGRLYENNAGVVCGEADEITDYGYDARGRQSSINYPNGITRTMAFSELTGQVQEVSYKTANGGLVFSDSYEYMPASRLYKSITHTTAVSRDTTYYEYDINERVKTVTEANGRYTEYRYDVFGNRVEEKIINTKGNTQVVAGEKDYGTYTYEYVANSNRLSRMLYNDTEQESYGYDAAGRITSRAHTIDGTTTYSYDDRGMLVSLSKPGYTISYTYDALKVRKTKTVNGVTTRYISAQIFGFPRTLVEADTSMNITATYVHGGGQILKEEGSTTDRSQDLYYLTDGTLGSVRYTVDMAGKVQSTSSYDTFGQRSVEQTGTLASNGHYGYTGEMTEPESGLIYLRARYYDPSLGRFISVDPFLGRLEQPVTQNRYIYVHNNPLLYTDPSGLAVPGCSEMFQSSACYEPLQPGPTQGSNLSLNMDWARDPSFWNSASAQFGTAAGLSSRVPQGLPAAGVFTFLAGASKGAALYLEPDVEQYSQEVIVDLGFGAIPNLPPQVTTFGPPLTNALIDYYESKSDPCP